MSFKTLIYQNGISSQELPVSTQRECLVYIYIYIYMCGQADFIPKCSFGILGTYNSSKQAKKKSLLIIAFFPGNNSAWNAHSPFVLAFDLFIFYFFKVHKIMVLGIGVALGSVVVMLLDIEGVSLFDQFFCLKKCKMFFSAGSQL